MGSSTIQERQTLTLKRVKGEAFRFRVKSRSGKDWHTVDMTERGGHGACSCKNFECVANPNFKRLGRHISYGREGYTECAHIAVCRVRIEDKFLRPILAAQVNGLTPEFRAAIKSIIKQ